jgi:hypothetical protein
MCCHTTQITTSASVLAAIKTSARNALVYGSTPSRSYSDFRTMGHMDTVMNPPNPNAVNAHTTTDA